MKEKLISVSVDTRGESQCAVILSGQSIRMFTLKAQQRQRVLTVS